MSWHRDWPLKPDGDFEGANIGIDPTSRLGSHVDMKIRFLGNTRGRRVEALSVNNITRLWKKVQVRVH